MVKFNTIFILLAFATVALLSMFLLFRNVSTTDNRVKCKNQIHQVGLAIALYRLQYKEMPSGINSLIQKDILSEQRFNRCPVAEITYVECENWTEETNSLIYCPACNYSLVLGKNDNYIITDK